MQYKVKNIFFYLKRSWSYSTCRVNQCEGLLSCGIIEFHIEFCRLKNPSSSFLQKCLICLKSSYESRVGRSGIWTQVSCPLHWWPESDLHMQDLLCFRTSDVNVIEQASEWACVGELRRKQLNRMKLCWQRNTKWHFVSHHSAVEDRVQHAHFSILQMKVFKDTERELEKEKDLNST